MRRSPPSCRGSFSRTVPDFLCGVSTLRHRGRGRPTPTSVMPNFSSWRRRRRKLLSRLSSPVISTTLPGHRPRRCSRKSAACSIPRIGRGLYPSFNADWPLMKWPLDHLFASEEWTLNDFKAAGGYRLRSLSDHGRPLPATGGSRQTGRRTGRTGRPQGGGGTYRGRDGKPPMNDPLPPLRMKIG